MSRPADPKGTNRQRSEAGFTLVEVVVAIGILSTLVVAVLPQLIGGIRANDTARSSTQAKALATSELERMRNLPFHVSRSSGPFVDLFDRYYRNLSVPAAAPTCTSGGRSVAPTAQNIGYVAAGTARCSWEPSGPFYRQVRTQAQDPDLEDWVVVVGTQFLSPATPPAPVPPRAAYDTQVEGQDTPASAQVGVTVTVLPATPSTRRPVTTSTQIARTYQTTTRVRALVDVAALEVSTFTPDQVEVQATGSQLNLDASLVASSRVAGVAAGVSSSTGTGQRAGNGLLTVAAPPDVTATTPEGTGGSLDATGCALVCWGGARVSSPVDAVAAAGLPGIGSPTAPVEVSLKEPSAGGYALRFSAGADAAYLPGLQLAVPLLRLRSGTFGAGVGSGCSVDQSGSGLRLSSGGWVRTTGATDTTSPTTVDACATTRTAPVSLLPTSFAPDGVVRVHLQRASARCTVAGAGHAASTAVDYSATVEYFSGASTNGGYTPLGTVTPSTTDDFLDYADLDTLQVGTRGPLSKWIDSWSVITSSRVVRTAADGAAAVEVPAIVNVLTQPLRQQGTTSAPVVDASGAPVPDPFSTMSVTVGSLTCSAKDAR